jgi:hypothetical protein
MWDGAAASISALLGPIILLGGAVVGFLLLCSIGWFLVHSVSSKG